MYIDDFEAYLIHEKNYSTYTVQAYMSDLNSFIDYLELDSVAIDEVEYVNVRSWIVHLVDIGNSNRTVNRKVASLKAYYNFIQRIGIRSSNPLVYHQPLKVDIKVRVPFSQKEMANAFEQTIDSSDFNAVRDLLIIGLLYATGIRRAELIGLTKESIQLQDRKIRVLGKGNKERMVPLLPWCVELLEDYLLLREKIPNADRASNLLLTKKGKPIYPSLVYRAVKETFEKVSGKQTQSPHIIRHSFATHLLDEGADLVTIKELLGHASLASTQVYTHNSMKKLMKVYNSAHPRNRQD